MIKCHFSTMLGARKLKIADVARATGIHRNTLRALYHENAKRIEIDVIDSLCEYFSCSIEDLIEYQPQKPQ